ncbi:hypothetical protein JOC70_000776 [Clostridium pascui]|uniref:hypothetical protein n=1 Tax=Clostridium pascui TaxID=46609 RepID=UPI00195A6F4F|nr:hypothetical protein [Clostridium pascui]MBM7869307.1 hypothetical protein [Clostridium pascui]
MSYEKQTTYMGENKSILKLSGELFQNVSVKAAKADLTAALNADEVLPAGTILTQDGKFVDGTTIADDKAYGLVYRDVNFKYSNGNESVPVTVFGFINESALPVKPSTTAKAAMKMLLFV